MAKSLTLEAAQTIIKGALEKALALRLSAMSVAVLDDGGHLETFGHEYDPWCGPATASAMGKAVAAVDMGAKGSRIWEQTAMRPAQMHASSRPVHPTAPVNDVKKCHFAAPEPERGGYG